MLPTIKVVESERRAYQPLLLPRLCVRHARDGILRISVEIDELQRLDTKPNFLGM